VFCFSINIHLIINVLLVLAYKDQFQINISSMLPVFGLVCKATYTLVLFSADFGNSPTIRVENKQKLSKNWPRI